MAYQNVGLTCIIKSIGSCIYHYIWGYDQIIDKSHHDRLRLAIWTALILVQVLNSILMYGAW